MRSRWTHDLVSIPVIVSGEGQNATDHEIYLFVAGFFVGAGILFDENGLFRIEQWLGDRGLAGVQQQPNRE